MRTIVSLFAIAATVGVVATVGLQAQGTDGKALYEKKCAMCHGKDGVAKKLGKGSADLNDPEWQETPLEDVIKDIVDGVGKMKGYKDKLSEEEIKAIAEYCKTL